MKKQTLKLGGILVISMTLIALVALRVHSPASRTDEGTQVLERVVEVTDDTGSTTGVDTRRTPEQATGSQDAQATTESSGSDQDLVRFASTDAKAAFMAHNAIQSGGLAYIQALEVYVVPKNTIKTTGVTTFSSQRYHALLTPNDTFYSSQWHLPKVLAPAAWDNTTGDSTVTVAIIDTGFALTHQDLDSKWAVNDGESGSTVEEGVAPNCTSRGLPLDKSCNNIDDDNDEYVDNKIGWDFVSNDSSVQAGEVDPTNSAAAHGTLVSGLVAAESSNAQGMSGVTWGPKILPLQALGDNGEGDTVSVALAIRYAVMHGAKVINLSLGSVGSDPLVAEQVDYAYAQGVVVVAAAGNDNVGSLSYPANYSTVVAVGASDSNDVRASFSNYGSNLALLAPGTSICSTSWSNANQTSRYTCGSAGTSFSSPIVAGSVALLLSQDSSLTPAQVKTALTATATKVGGMSGQSFTTLHGYGRLNVYDALKTVSLAKPLGLPLSTRQVSLSAGTGYLRPEMNATCVSYVADAVCRVRAIRTSDNLVLWPDGGIGVSTDANIYWNASTLGLTSGSWIVQTYIEAGGKRSMVNQEALTVSP